MLQNKKLIQLIISAAMTLLVIQLYFKAKEQNIELGFGMINVLAAAKDIPPNQAITADLLTVKQVASRDIEPGAFREKLPGEARKRVVGKVTMSAIPAGGQILVTNLRNPSALETGIVPMLPPGKRGYVLRLGNLDVAKLILPGDHIDILATFTVRQKGSDATSKITYTILQNIQVVAVDKDIIQQGRDVTGKKETSEGRLLTLAVSSVEAEQLAHALIESGGEISVVVRAHGDDQTNPIPPVSAANLLDRPAQPPAAPKSATQP
jgi:Flp pilus assembly protein CpaB